MSGSAGVGGMGALLDYCTVPFFIISFISCLEEEQHRDGPPFGVLFLVLFQVGNTNIRYIM